MKRDVVVPKSISSNDSEDDESSMEGDAETGNGTLSERNHHDNAIDSSDDDHDSIVMDEFEESNQMVTVLAAGESILPLDSSRKTRHVANGCAICLCEFFPQEQITWAASPKCRHVFHSDCILQWMLACGRKEQKKRRRRQQRQELLNTEDALKNVVTFPMQCPCCRQQFVVVNDDDDNNVEQQQTSVLLLDESNNTVEEEVSEANATQVPANDSTGEPVEANENV